MPLSTDQSHGPIIRKLESIFPLSDAERQAIERLPVNAGTIQAGQDIVREGDRPTRCFAILGGFTCAFKITGGGKRQITGFHIPGDIPDVQSLHLDTLDVSFGTIARCSVGFIQHEHLRDMFSRHPRISDAFWRETLIDAAIFREWIVNTVAVKPDRE
jgi:CRP-like cAMP-binding protein